MEPDIDGHTADTVHITDKLLAALDRRDGVGSFPDAQDWGAPWEGERSRRRPLLWPVVAGEEEDGGTPRSGGEGHASQPGTGVLCLGGEKGGGGEI